jgi:LemA protein
VPTMTAALAGVAAVLVLSGYTVWLYNRLVRLRNLARSSWADIDVLLKKRHDLVENLVETVKGYAVYEKATLLGVTEARARAVQAEGPAEKGKEETVLGERLRSLLALAESYPDLKASDSFIELQKSLTEMENGIEYARRYYNAVVRDYKTATEVFPSNLVSARLGFGKEEFFQLDSPAERERTDVRLS